VDSYRFLFVSADAALIGDVARQVHDEGHEVRYYVESEQDREIADSFVPKTDDWRTDLDWADTLVFDTDDGAATTPPDGVRVEDAKCVALDGDPATAEPCDPRDREGGQWRVAGESGMPLVVGIGDTIRDARREAYERVDSVPTPYHYYRDDIGDRWISGRRPLAGVGLPRAGVTELSARPRCQRR
jgi:hypothetical protein